MYGVPKNLDLTALVGATLRGVSFHEYSLALLFDSGHTITVEARLALRDPVRNVHENGRPDELRNHSHLPAVVGSVVEQVSVAPPESLTLHFSGGAAITLYDESKQYESFHIEPGGIIV